MKLDNAYMKGRLLIHPFKVPAEHHPYFRDNKLYAGYGVPVNVDQSLLNIPLVSSIITYFWMMNKPLEVPVLDEDYVKNLEYLQKFFSDTYDMDFSSELIVKKTVKNTPESDESLLFFSGGLDSTYSLYDNLEKHPRMFMICGYDMYMNSGVALQIRNLWHRIYSKFAEDIQERINFSYTNSRWLLHENRVQRDSDKKGIKSTTYWGYLRHGICLTGLAAPLADRFGAMITSANGRAEWDTTTRDNAFATGTNIDPYLGYGGNPCHYHGTIDRFLKAEKMRDFLNTGVATLRICYKPTLKLNCMICEKCLRTLTQLTVAGVDAGKCGLKDTRKEYALFRNMFQNYEIKSRRIHIHFKPMQKYIEKNNPTLPKHSHIFYDYLMKTDLDKYLKEYAAKRRAG